MSGLAERLAREACRKVYVNPESEPAYAIAVEAARAALDEAAKTARFTASLSSDPSTAHWGEQIAAAIEAL